MQFYVSPMEFRPMLRKQGNQIPDDLIRSGSDLPAPNSTDLWPSTFHSLNKKYMMNLTWRVTYAHHWYAVKKQACLCGP